MELAWTPIETGTRKLEGAKQGTVHERTLPFPLPVSPACRAVTLLMQIVVDLMMDDCFSNAVQRSFASAKVNLPVLVGSVYAGRRKPRGVEDVAIVIFNNDLNPYLHGCGLSFLVSLLT